MRSGNCDGARPGAEAMISTAAPIRTLGILGLAVAAIAIPLASGAHARQGAPGSDPTQFLHPLNATRIADPKLVNGRVEVSYRLEVSRTPYDVTIDLLTRPTGKLVTNVLHVVEKGSNTPRTRVWDGRDAQDQFVDPGAYTIRIEARNAVGVTRRAEFDLDIVRLGIESIAAESSSSTATNEWQTVYFMKRANYAFYATPATGEYLSRAETGDVSDLDLNDGSARPATAIHTGTAEPVLELGSGGTGYIYDNDEYNYPLCYLQGARPQFTVTFGDTCTLANGTQGTCNYPVPGFDIRCIATDDVGGWSTTQASIAPGGTQTLKGPALPAIAMRNDRTVTWRWQYRRPAAATWQDVPG